MILYHDNHNGKQYGEDGKLTNNWNPDGDYADNEYVSVYFRINTPTYRQGKYFMQFDTEEEAEAFNKEKLEVFKSLGWEMDKPDYNGRCMDVVKGKASLYLHPDDFSGNMLKKKVKEVAEALAKEHQTFSLRWVDLYDTVYDISDEEYKAYLETQRDTARELIFKNCKTTRTNKYRYYFDVTYEIAKRIMRPRIGCRSNHEPTGMDREFVSNVIEELVTEGYLIKAEWNGDDYVRTSNKGELKAKKLKEIA